MLYDYESVISASITTVSVGFLYITMDSFTRTCQVHVSKDSFDWVTNLAKVPSKKNGQNCIQLCEWKNMKLFQYLLNRMSTSNHHYYFYADLCVVAVEMKSL